MRNFNIMAAVAVALLAGGTAVAAEEQTARPKARKICHVEEDSTSRLGARRICQTITERQQPVRSEPQQAAAKPAGTTSASN